MMPAATVPRLETENTMPNHKRTTDWRNAATIVAAGLLAAAGLAVTTTPAAAQQRSTNDGRALDANMRVGSNGRNDTGTDNIRYNRNGPMYTGNQVVTGNVTAGRQFRGPVGYSDPNEFRGITAGRFTTDRFVRDSGPPVQKALRRVLSAWAATSPEACATWAAGVKGGLPKLLRSALPPRGR